MDSSAVGGARVEVVVVKVFMLGWEFPPAVSGGLGVACYGLTKALNGMGVNVMFLLPKPLGGNGMRGAGMMREVASASRDDVQNAVERAVAAGAMGGAERAKPGSSSGATSLQDAQKSTNPAATSPQKEGFGEPMREVSDVERELVQRVTFVPVDVLLQPYMTPTQYRTMVVEEYLHEKPVTRWERDFTKQGHTPQWTERAVGSEPEKLKVDLPTEEGKRGYIEEPARKAEFHGNSFYAGDLFLETERYAQLALSVARTEKFDVIHGHDWMTFEAGMAVASATGRPLILQIHSTELDRAGHAANARILEIERQGMAAATRIIAVSYKTKTQLIEKYGVDPRKIEVVYNAGHPDDVSQSHNGHHGTEERAAKREKVVLFLGRLTHQKGPGYFLQAAKKLLAVEPEVRFVIAGKGEMLEELKELADELEIRKRVTFTGFLKKAEQEKAFRSADVYVMPSVSEPFGIAPLEALSHDVPVIISKQSGVAEVLQHVLKVDFWDTEDLADKMLAVLRHPSLATTLREEGHDEARQLSWDDSARRVAEVYKEVGPRRGARVQVKV